MMRLGIVAVAIVFCGAGLAAARGPREKQASCVLPPEIITTNICNVTTEPIGTYLNVSDAAIVSDAIEVTNITAEIGPAEPPSTGEFVFRSTGSSARAPCSSPA